MTAGALERVIRRGGTRRQADHGRCELCSLRLPESHQHMLDVDGQSVLCACRACSLLFHREAASEGRYRLIPERRLRLHGVSPAALGVPVGLAFFVIHGDGGVHAHYPSPAGATRWDVDADVWAQVVRTCPRLADLATDVEALLVNTARGRSDAWLVPVDDCFRLVAVVRRHWRGLYGGDEVWAEIEKFFEDLRRRDG